MSFDGFTSYLLIVDEALRHMLVFLTSTKDPRLDLIDKFLTRFGHPDGGSIRTDQGGELAGSQKLVDMVLWQYNYVIEPTGADSPSQNGMVETYNDKLAIRTCTLLYGAGLSAKYQSVALLHDVYLNNCLVHSLTQRTPFEGFYGRKPDITYLKIFGSWVCVKCLGVKRSKLDCHDFTGIFLGYTASGQNIWYLDLESGVVKETHHATCTI
jgi:hypothetical protein